jgi:hypothetical protein
MTSAKKYCKLVADLTKQELCYTLTMNADQTLWQAWAQALRRFRLDQLVATLLEAAGPLSLLGAQMVYLGQPLLKGSVTEEKLTALAALLEDSRQTRAFAAYLREET